MDLDEQRNEHSKECQNNSSGTLYFFWGVSFPPATCRTGKGGAAPLYSLESAREHTGSNLVLEQLYLLFSILRIKMQKEQKQITENM